MRSEGFGFRVSGFGFRFSGFGFRVSGFGFSGFGFRVSGFGFRVSGFGFRFSGFGISEHVSDEVLEVLGLEAEGLDGLEAVHMPRRLHLPNSDRDC